MLKEIKQTLFMERVSPSEEKLSACAEANAEYDEAQAEAVLAEMAFEEPDRTIIMPGEASSTDLPDSMLSVPGPSPMEWKDRFENQSAHRTPKSVYEYSSLKISLSVVVAGSGLLLIGVLRWIILTLIEHGKTLVKLETLIK